MGKELVGLCGVAADDEVWWVDADAVPAKRLVVVRDVLDSVDVVVLGHLEVAK